MNLQAEALPLLEALLDAGAQGHIKHCYETSTATRSVLDACG